MDLPSAESTRVTRENPYLTERLQRSAAAVAGVQALLERRESQRVAKAAADLKARAEGLQLYLQRLSAGSTRSAAIAVGKAVEFDLSRSRARLTSSEPVNTNTRAATPRAPLWDGGSTAQPTIGGTYDGSLGTTSLRFTVTRAGEHGSDNVRVQVTDDNSGYSERINVRANHPLSRSYRLDNDIRVQFGPGHFEINDAFSLGLQVDDAVRPDPLGAFDGSDGTDANLEPGLGVGAGSFTVNGETIEVASDDSIASVIDRINASAAGVVATYSADTETFSLQQQVAGRVPTIEVGADTSGLLAAMKLDSALVVSGVDPDLHAAIAEVPALRGVVSGSFLINGVSIGVDIATDSISSVLSRISASAAGVKAKLSLNAFLSIRQLDGGELSLDSNGTNLFEAFGISRTRFSPRAATRPPDSKLFEVSRQAQDLMDGVNKLFDSPSSGLLAPVVAELRRRLGQLVEQEIRKPLAALGLRPGLRFSAPADREAFTDLNSAELRRGLRWRFAAVQSVFAGGGSTGSGGALGRLAALLDGGVLMPPKRGEGIDEIV